MEQARLLMESGHSRQAMLLALDVLLQALADLQEFLREAKADLGRLQGRTAGPWPGQTSPPPAVSPVGRKKDPRTLH